jgi:hypothetical protein
VQRKWYIHFDVDLVPGDLIPPYSVRSYVAKTKRSKKKKFESSCFNFLQCTEGVDRTVDRFETTNETV